MATPATPPAVARGWRWTGGTFHLVIQTNAKSSATRNDFMPGSFNTGTGALRSFPMVW